MGDFWLGRGKIKSKTAEIGVFSVLSFFL